jgi:hypothetical protein
MNAPLSTDQKDYTMYFLVMITVLGFIAGSLIGIGKDLRAMRQSMTHVEASRVH